MKTGFGVSIGADAGLEALGFEIAVEVDVGTAPVELELGDVGLGAG